MLNTTGNETSANLISKHTHVGGGGRARHRTMARPSQVKQQCIQKNAKVMAMLHNNTAVAAAAAAYVKCSVRERALIYILK